MKPEQIPYGVKDFKRIRLENFHYVKRRRIFGCLRSECMKPQVRR